MKRKRLITGFAMVLAAGLMACGAVSERPSASAGKGDMMAEISPTSDYFKVDGDLYPFMWHYDGETVSCTEGYYNCNGTMGCECDAAGCNADGTCAGSCAGFGVECLGEYCSGLGGYSVPFAHQTPGACGTNGGSCVACMYGEACVAGQCQAEPGATVPMACAGYELVGENPTHDTWCYQGLMQHCTAGWFNCNGTKGCECTEGCNADGSCAGQCEGGECA